MGKRFLYVAALAVLTFGVFVLDVVDCRNPRCGPPQEALAQMKPTNANAVRTDMYFKVNLEKRLGGGDAEGLDEEEDTRPVISVKVSPGVASDADSDEPEVEVTVRGSRKNKRGSPWGKPAKRNNKSANLAAGTNTDVPAATAIPPPPPQESDAPSVHDQTAAPSFEPAPQGTSRGPNGRPSVANGTAAAAHVPWNALKQYGFAPDEEFRLEFAAVQAETRAAAFAKFDEVRAASLAELKRREGEEPLEGLEPRLARAVRKVCSLEEDVEELKMCERRGRRMVDNIREHYGKLRFSHTDAERQFNQYARRTVKIAEDEAEAGQKYRVKSHFVRVQIAGGRIVSHDTGGFKKYRKSFYNNQEVTALAWLEGILRTLPTGREGITCEVLLQVDDRCHLFAPERDVPPVPRLYPLVAYSKRADWCPHVTTLMWDSIVQHYAFNNTETASNDADGNPVDFRSLQSKMTFRGSGWGPERYFFSAASASRLLPYVDAGITSWRKACRKNLSPLYQGRYTNPLQGTQYVDPAKACGAKGNEDDESTWTPVVPFRGKVNGLETARTQKYLLLVDGFSALFRLAPNLQLPGIVFLHPHSRYELSFYPDMLPYVHYIPLDMALKFAAGDLDHAYHWLEENPDIAEDIAKRSTDFARRHANEVTMKHSKRDWFVFLNLLTEMYVTPPDTLSASISEDGLAFGCDNGTSAMFDVFHETAVEFAVKNNLSALACG